MENRPIASQTTPQQQTHNKFRVWDEKREILKVELRLCFLLHLEPPILFHRIIYRMNPISAEKCK